MNREPKVAATPSVPGGADSGLADHFNQSLRRASSIYSLQVLFIHGHVYFSN